MTTERRPAAPWVAVLAWCIVAGWFAFVRHGRVPLLGFVDFGFHELGHLVMYVFPISEVLTAAMGSVAQCAIPGGLALYFWFARRDGVGASAALAWCATNFQDVSVYIADAPYQRLELVGGKHDWATILGPQHLDRLRDAQTIANITRTTGMVLLCVALVGAFRGLLSTASDSGSEARGPDAATESRSDDLLPST